MPSPKNNAVEDSHDQQSHSVMPTEAHGDEHDVAMILKVPLGSAQRIQHKSNLRHDERDSIQLYEYHEWQDFILFLSDVVFTW